MWLLYSSWFLNKWFYLVCQNSNSKINDSYNLFFLVNQIYSYSVVQPIPEQLTQISCFFVVNQSHAALKYSPILELITVISCFFN